MLSLEGVQASTAVDPQSILPRPTCLTSPTRPTFHPSRSQVHPKSPKNNLRNPRNLRINIHPQSQPSLPFHFVPFLSLSL